MRRAIGLGLLVLPGLLSCRTPANTDTHARDAPRASAHATDARPPASVAVSDALPPAVERACSRDDECAVARVETSGERACCWACATTPGTRRWHAKLQRYCAAHTPTTCPPLACPQGPTRAVCRAGVCEATATGVDGGATSVAVERRCLPALVCDAWAGCTLAVGNAQDGWFAEQSERVARGELVGLERVATSGGTRSAEAFRLYPSGVQCAPHTIPPILAPPLSCAIENGQCKRR